jgi:hypothetical protein
VNLKPQDVAVALKLSLYVEKRPPIAAIAGDLFLSPSEVHAALGRLHSARLLHGPELHDRPILPSLEEFLLHGVKYAFPAEHGMLTRGLPTSVAAPPLDRKFVRDDEPPPVWPMPEGGCRGLAFKPLYKGAPRAALRDPLLYELLALLDAIRDGRARERKLAEQELCKRLKRLKKLAGS